MSLGLALQNLFKSPDPGIVPDYGTLRDTSGDAGAPQTPIMPTMPKPMSHGQIIAGILADALAGAAGRPAAFGQLLNQQREKQQEEVQWQRRRAEGIQDYGTKQRIDQQYAKPPEAPQIVRLQQIYDDPNTPPSIRATVKAAIEAQTNPVVTTPTGLVTRSMVTGALNGGGQPSGPAPGTVEGGFRFKGGNAADPNAWEPVGAGGPMPSASATFR